MKLPSIRCKSAEHLHLGLAAGVVAFLSLLAPAAAIAQGAGGSGGGSGGSGGGQGGQAGASFPARVEDYADCHFKNSLDDWRPGENRDLSDAFNKNQWRKVEKAISGFFGRIECTGVDNLEDVDLDPARSYFSVLFLDETLPAPTLERVVVHKFKGVWKVIDPKNSDLPEVYGTRIGDYGLLDVRLLPSGVFAVSQYTVGSSPNALVTQIPSVIAASSKASVPLATASPLAAQLATGSGHKAFNIDGGKEPQPEQLPTECFQTPLKEKEAKPRSFLIRRVTVPKSFKRHFPRVIPSVTPTLAIADQLTFSVGLEAYLLESQDDRAVKFDDDLDFRDQLPGANHAPLQALEQHLFVSYVRCRMPITVDVTSQAATSRPKEKPLVIVRVRYPAANAALTQRLQVHVEVKNPDGLVVETFDRNIPPPGSGGGTSVCKRLDPLDPAGQYKITAQVREKEDPGEPPPSNLPAVVQATSVLTITGDDKVQGTLDFKEPSSATVTWGAKLTLVPTVTNSAIGDAHLQILDSPSGTVLSDEQLPSTTPQTKLVDTAPIGVGDRLAVLLAKDKSGALVTVARLPFTVTEKTASLASAGPPPSGPACLTLDDRALVGVVSDNQAIASDFTSLFSTYSGLLTLAGPSPPSATSTQYTLGRLTKWAFSLGVGGIAATSFYMPASPLTQPMTWVALDWHPWEYDETRYAPTVKERFRIIYGVSLTPGVGGVIGAGIGLVRGLALEGGFTFQLANVVTGKAPSTCPSTNDDTPGAMMTKCPAPTGRRGLGGWFVGLGYSFQ